MYQLIFSKIPCSDIRVYKYSTHLFPKITVNQIPKLQIFKEVDTAATLHKSWNEKRVQTPTQVFLYFAGGIITTNTLAGFKTQALCNQVTVTKSDQPHSQVCGEMMIM